MMDWAGGGYLGLHTTFFFFDLLTAFSDVSGSCGMIFLSLSVSGVWFSVFSHIK